MERATRAPEMEPDAPVTITITRVCEVGTVGKISDYQPEGPGFNPRPGRELNFGRPFATPSVDRDVTPLVSSLNVLSGDLKEPTHLSIGVG